ncbi:3-keto-disaccharide hydrolase [Oleiharenicola lentus]|nr:DUF1080 domain-containing protein [Oleiharenicola lentus]
MKLIRFITFSALFVAVMSAAPAPTPLFNGRDLTDWEIWLEKGVEPTEAAKIFTVADGVIHVYPQAKAGARQPFGGLVTKQSYSRYVLQLEYRWGEHKFAPRAEAVRDAGVLFHLHETNVIWPASVECQIQEGDTGDLWAIQTRVTSPVQNVIRNYSERGTPETRGGKDARFARFHRSYCHEQPGWNKLELTVDGATAVFRVNGYVVNAVTSMERWDAATQTYVPLTFGRILLQAEGAEVFYRNITITPLTP